MGYREQNAKKIDQAFATSISRMDNHILAGMSALLDAGMAYCLAHHDEIVGGVQYHHPHHELMRDSYGWVLLHNGVEVARRINPAPGDTDKAGREVRGKAGKLLNDVRGQAHATGWCGIVLASVVPPTYFKLSAEFKMMREAVRDLKSEDFDYYFQRLPV